MGLNTNVVVLAGRVCIDPEEKTFDNGGSVVKLSISFLESSYKDKAGKWVYKNGFITVKKNFSGQASSDYMMNMVKGTHVQVQGHLGFEEWGGQGGKPKVSKIVLVADKITGLDASSHASEGGGGQQRQQQQGRKPAGGGYDAPNPDEGYGDTSTNGDIPF